MTNETISDAAQDPMPNIQPRYNVAWRLFPHLDLIQASGIVSGLATLSRLGQISLSIDFKDDAIEVPYTAMELVVTSTSTGATRNVVLDFYDRSDKLIPSALAFADVYFKRQYDGATESAAASVGARHVRPLGLTIAGLSRSSWWLVAAELRASLRTARARNARANWSALLGAMVADARMWLRVPSTDSARVEHAGGRASRIVFQPRLWDTTPGSGDLFDVANEDRIATVAALREAFSSDASIGLVHTPFAQRVAPHLLTSSKIRTQTYHRQLRDATIGVNCVGLSGSVGWKFAEYLAAGLAVVSQPIEKELLAPIEAGIHYLPYTSPLECIEQCRRLLADEALTERMGAANLDYFRRWVDPPAHIMNLIEISMNTTPGVSRA
jgi:hypothetical protein